MFFSFDGIDGAGKSTQINLLAEWLRARGNEVVTCRDPGSTSLGEQLRGLLLNHHDTPIHRRSEMLMYMAARAQLVEEIIRPALAAGKSVVSDRYLLANVVYQGHAGGLLPEEVWQVGQITVSGIMPSLTFLLDIPAATAAARFNRAPDRMEAQGLDYMEKVRQGFLLEAAKRPREIVLIDATQTAEKVHEQIVTAALSTNSIS
jgi:dTMP kinase